MSVGSAAASSVPPQRRVHRRTIAAQPESVYELVADVTRWPVLFEPTVDVRVLVRTETTERFELTALVNENLATWRSKRSFDRARLSIQFAQEHSMPPLRLMTGAWTFVPTVDGKCEVVLEHEFAVEGDDPDAVAWVSRALDANSERELAALARVAEIGQPIDDIVFAFEETLPLRGAAADAFEFIRRGDLWAQRLPHVASARMTESGGVQHLTMSTLTPDGSEHTTRSLRLVRDGERLVFKQTAPPSFLIGHAGEWRFTDGPDGAHMTVRHIVALDPTALDALLGPGSVLQDGRVWIIESLGNNSRTTASYASVFAEGRAGREASLR